MPGGRAARDAGAGPRSAGLSRRASLPRAAEAPVEIQPPQGPPPARTPPSVGVEVDVRIPLVRPPGMRHSALVDTRRLDGTDPAAAPRYTLTGSDGRPYRSDVAGRFGGYRRGRIYGRLDCPSALRHIARGNYVRHRVFFADEATAVAAGYRPCSVCLPPRHRAWRKEEPS